MKRRAYVGLLDDRTRKKKPKTGMTITEHIFENATYIRKIEIKISSKDISDPTKEINIKIFTTCMQHKGNRVTTDVTRVLQYKNDQLMWKGEKFKALNYGIALKEVRKMMRDMV